jgi:hypothetical protein
MTAPQDPVQQYLGQLRVSLHGRDAGRILAEAEDHLREGTAAGLAAGLTEAEAAKAAISSFGSVRAVVRAHRTRRGLAAAVLSGLAVALSKVTGLFLVAFSVTSLVTVADFELGTHIAAVNLWPAVGEHAVAGIVGLLLLAGSHLGSRFQRRRGRALATRSASFFPLAAVILFGAAATALAALKASGVVPVGGPPILACLAVAVGYAVRMRMLRRTGRLA